MKSILNLVQLCCLIAALAFMLSSSTNGFNPLADGVEMELAQECCLMTPVVVRIAS